MSTSSLRYPLDPTDLKTSLLNEFGGKHYKSLPTPSLIIKESVVDNNITKLLDALDTVNTGVENKIKYRAHIKTHKTIEGSLKQLGYNVSGYNGTKYSSIVVSTMREAYLISDYQDKTGETVVDDVVYGLPVAVGDIIPELITISQKFKKFTIFIDNVQHIENIKQYVDANKDQLPKDFKFSVYIKIDMGTHRAGVFGEDDLIVLIKKFIENKEYFNLYGFYAHGGHSYSADSMDSSRDVLMDEINSVNDAVTTLIKLDESFKSQELTISVGASPTIRAFQHTELSKWQNLIDTLNGNLELHAGNYLISDLQQVATGTVSESDISTFILGTVLSQYPKRNTEIGEMLTNTGVLAMTKETSHKFKGFGQLPSDSPYGVWYLNRLSQEHGILQPLSGDCKMIPIGEKIEILLQHVCINMACFGFFFVINTEGIVSDVWVPCRGW